jgi:hypothetical protein
MSWNIEKPGDQINGPVNITGNLTVDTNTLFVDSVNNRVGVLTTTPTVPLDVSGNAKVSGTLSVQGRDIKSSIRAAASNYAGVAFDGATTGTRVVSTTTTQPISTGDFSVWIRCKIPSVSSTNQDPLFALGSTSAADGSGAYGLLFRVLTSSNLVDLLIRDSSGGSSGAGAGNASATFTHANYAGQVVDFVITRTGSTIAIYANGTSLSVSYTNQSNLANPIGNWPTATTQYFGVGASTTTPYRDAIYRSVLFNRALSAADVVDLIETGVNPADQWGTQTQLLGPSTLNGGFETAGAGGADVFANWIETTAGTSTVNRDTSVFYDGTASCRFDLDAFASGALVTSNNVDYVRGKRFRVSCYARGTATLARLNVNTGVSYQPLGEVLDNNSWQYRSLEFVCFGGQLDVVVGRHTGAASGSIWLDNFTVERIGAIVDLDLTKGIGTTAYDRSTNNLDGTLNGGVSWTDPKTQPVVLEAGSISAPSLTAAGDTNTGLYFPAADTLALATGGSNRLYISANGETGIGLTPGSIGGMLQIGVPATQTGSGAANTVVGIDIKETVSGSGRGIWLGSMTNENTGVIGSKTASGNIAFQTYSGGWGERFRIKSTGQLRFVPLASDPAGAEAGDVYYNSSTNKLRCFNGTAWNDLF